MAYILRKFSALIAVFGFGFPTLTPTGKNARRLEKERMMGGIL